MEGRRTTGTRTLVTVSSRKKPVPPLHAGATSGPASDSQRWNALTDKLVAASSIPFSILVLPQVVQNAINMAGGHPTALSIISWEGYLSAMFGNTLMCSHFAASGERSAVNVQLVGILNNFLILTQVALAGFMPLAVFLAAAAFTAFATFMNLARVAALAGAAQPADEKWGSWQMWQLGSGLVGLAVVPQVLYNTVSPAASTLLPFICTLGLLGAVLGLRLSSKGGSDAATLVRQLPGWGATLLFALSPLPQLVRNLLEPQSLEGLSVGTMLLALLGNALMVPRALFVRDVVWLSGTCWACVAGWGQLFSMFRSASAATGRRFLDPWLFFSITGALLLYTGYVVVQHRRATAAAASPRPA
ncbi:hypothetical protein CHLRE_12g486600v5 [Chlamydomonas reinhardtii]|uniref:Uncharacterized protein n=1 Tax=Chlamydomonas reinhardtii TaxID=3055 RepID=A0A2K3D2D7_CHLRE|nr:uncharacterized protein CHLRE_12g486600v5 [Chlamydomonas reinhardtii]PNW74698.1 hypothetical protein CHLRE_12g486600v5 [Chlamydomonas reinhardtii]